MELQLAETGTIPPSNWDWFEVKLDGTRICAVKEGNKIKLINRRGIQKTQQYPEVEAALQQISFDCVLDGECTATNFFSLMGRDKTTDPIKMKLLQKSCPVQYNVFDILEIDGKNLRNLSLRERKRILEQNVHENKTLKIVRAEPLEILEQKMARDEIEGFIAKNPDAPYVGRRTKDWLKYKRERNEDATIIGITRTDKSSREFRALIIRTADGKEHHCSSGMTRDLISKIYADVMKLPRVENKNGIYLEKDYGSCEISYYPDQTTNFRFPKFLRLKDEK